MGQRHQLFIIAKVHAKYRTLAAVHAQYLYGRAAVRQCLHLLRILQSEANRIALHRELKRAEQSVWKTPLDDIKPKTWSSFPFVGTCLVVGASFHDDEDYSARIHTLSLETTYKQVDNNDGISIYDISDPANPRYGFVLLEDRYFKAEDDDDDDDDDDISYGDPDIDANTVVDARTYLRIYDNEEEQAEVEETLAGCDKFPLISVATLESLWSGVVWTSMGDGHAQVPEAADVHDTLKDSTLPRTVDEAFASENEEIDWLSDAERLPEFLPAVLARIHAVPALIHRPAGIPLFVRALAGSSNVDLTMFPDLTSPHTVEILSAVSRSSNSKTITLHLPDLPMWTLEHLEAVASTGSIAALHLGTTSIIELGALLVLVSKMPSIKEFTCAALFSRALQMLDSRAYDIDGILQNSPTFPNGQGTPYPLAETIYLRQYTLAGEHFSAPPRLATGGIAWSKHFADITRGLNKWDYTNSGLCLLNMPLSDALLTTSRLSRDLPRTLRRAFAAEPLELNLFSLSYVAIGFATQLAFGGEEEESVIRPIPGRLYGEWERLGRSSTEVPPFVRGLREGECTLLVIQEKCQPMYEYPRRKLENASGEKGEDVFRYAFVGLNEKGQVIAMDAEQFFEKAGSRSGLDGGGELAATIWSRNLRKQVHQQLEVGAREPRFTLCSVEETQEAFAGMELHNKGIEAHQQMDIYKSRPRRRH